MMPVGIGGMAIDQLLKQLCIYVHTISVRILMKLLYFIIHCSNLHCVLQGEPSEPLYAKVVKNRGHDEMGGPPSPNHMMMAHGDPGPEGADSWV